MVLDVLDLDALRRWVVAARSDLATYAERINNLNVFPVPDADTGTNLLMTVDGAMGSLTFTPSVPAGTMILASTPSSTASTSMVALSVSISAITSPAETMSPTLTCHLARTPSSIVGDRAGIRMSVIRRSPRLA